MLPAGSYGEATATYLDAGNETGLLRVYGALLSSGDFTAQQTAWNTFLAKADALALGARNRDQYGNTRLYDVAQPTNGAAREVKLLVQCKDSVNGQRLTFTLPTLDPTIPHYVQNLNARDVILLDAPTAITDFVTATEAFVVNPRTGNLVTVIGLKVVGRNT